MSKAYTTLLLDAFDTVIHVDWSRVPLEEIDGERVMTTARAVYPVYAGRFGPVDFAAFYRAHRQSYEEAERLRALEFREISSQDRFRIMARLLGQDPSCAETEVFDRLAAAHMGQLSAAMEIRPDNLAALHWLAARYRCGMISNFDYAPALYRLLEAHEVLGLFESVVVSSEVGWRKPHPKIFETALRTLQITPSEALFVGDQLDLDVRGAAGVGMDVAWIETGREEWTGAHPAPTFTIRALKELIPILETT